MEQDASDSSAQGRLMRGVNGSDQQQTPRAEATNRTRSPLDFKIHFFIRRHDIRGQTSSVKKYKTDSRCCCCCVLLLILLTAVITLTTILLFKFLGNEGADVITRHTQYGTLKGRMVTAPGSTNKVQEFLGIPFAQPPIGHLRYADPEPIDAFPSEPYEATSHQSTCIQYLDKSFGDFVGTEMWNAQNPLSEDCLYLNLWLPHDTSNVTTKKPVMMWIYGGGFFSGSNELWVYDGKTLAAHGDVIVASFNYRVGSFGYLSTGDGRIKGNFGMKDQVMSLKWIHDNIEAFGGDPASVTIFGESSGASSAGLHMMSSHSEHLFQRAIFQSGSADSQWSFMSAEQAKERSQKFFKGVNCTMHDQDKLLKCLRDLDPYVILNNEWVDLRFMVFPWAPSVDHDFLTDTPYNLLKAGKYQHKDSLLGVNKDEGTFWILFSLPGFSKDHESLQNRTSFLRAIDTLLWDLPESTKDEVRGHYAPKDPNDQAAHRDALDKVCGDRSFTCPTKKLMEIYTEAGIRTHFYYLTHRASNEAWPPWMGVIHGAEIQWVFGMALNESRNYSPEEVEFAKTIMSYWVNFAKTGDPNGAALPQWPAYEESAPSFLEMRGPGNFKVNHTELRSSHCRIWDRVNRLQNKDLWMR